MYTRLSKPYRLLPVITNYANIQIVLTVNIQIDAVPGENNINIKKTNVNGIIDTPQYIQTDNIPTLVKKKINKSDIGVLKPNGSGIFLLYTNDQIHDIIQSIQHTITTDIQDQIINLQNAKTKFNNQPLNIVTV